MLSLQVFESIEQTKSRLKLEIGLARGKREYDKRETIKRKDTQRQMDRLKKIK